MDCCICTTMPFPLRPPRNTICGACYDGARNIIGLISKPAETDQKGTQNLNCSPFSPPNSCKKLDEVSILMLQMTKTMDEQTEAINFLKGFIAAFSEQIHTDILVKPGNDGPSIPAHKAILATRSEIFKNMLDSDECKTAPNGTITLPELNHEELKCLIEFLYSGSLTSEKLEKHGYSLLLAADKYEIPYLQRLCERHMHKSLSTSNALDFLEISSICSNKELMERSLSFIVKSFHVIAFLPKYDEFVHKNPHLALQVTREFLKSKGKTN